MLANLIGNALKYNREGRPVVVTVQRDGDSAALSVADQGIGIPAAGCYASSSADIAQATSPQRWTAWV